MPFGIAVLLWAIVGFASGAIAQTAEVAFDLSIEKGRVAANMRLIRVRQGDAVNLRAERLGPLELRPVWQQSAIDARVLAVGDPRKLGEVLERQ